MQSHYVARSAISTLQAGCDSPLIPACFSHLERGGADAHCRGFGAGVRLGGEGSKKVGNSAQLVVQQGAPLRSFPRGNQEGKLRQQKKGRNSDRKRSAQLHIRKDREGPENSANR